MSPKFIFLLFCGYLAALDVNANPLEKPSLRGVTILYVPYMTNNDSFQGFLIDLLNKISEKVGFNYQLYLSPDGAYGPGPNGTINGMIGEVNQTNADFALADLTITKTRKSFVDFTTPYMIDHLAMLIHKDYAKCMETFEDVSNYNGQLEDKSAQIPIGFINNGSTRAALAATNDKVGKRLHEYAIKDSANLVKTNWEGIERAKDTRFGIILASSTAEYYSNRICNLTVLRDNRNLVKHELAIALQKGSKWLEPFNRAIRELTDDGSIEKLRKAYWSGTCTR